MRRLSLRNWSLAISLLFALTVVGGVALTTYVIVSDGMDVVAYDTTQRVSSAAAAVVREVVAEASLEAASRGLTGAARARFADRMLRSRLPDTLESAGLTEAEFALYDGGDLLLWRSDPLALHMNSAESRARARQTGTSKRSFQKQGGLIQGLFSDARLSTSVVHMPVTLPDGSTGVLDVTYNSGNEERVIDAIRLPMGVLAVSAMFIMVLLMQTSMTWVLNLVDDLRQAADSIDAGRLDERLPDDANNEVGALARSINRLIERLGRRSEAQARFVADASHELATPVAGIRGYTSILKAWGAEDQQVRDEAIEAIDQESRRMARLTGDLLSQLHADQGLRLRTERFDLNVLVRERLAVTASRYLDKNIEFVGPAEESLVMVGDPERAEDVLSILLDNASKYAPVSGMVKVETDRRRELVTIRVSDTGVGISEADLPQIFDRFFRSDKARATGEAGFGLGLSIAKSIVESMAGSISVESKVGEGTTFTVVLPRGRL